MKTTYPSVLGWFSKQYHLNIQDGRPKKKGNFNPMLGRRVVLYNKVVNSHGRWENKNLWRGSRTTHTNIFPIHSATILLTWNSNFPISQVTLGPSSEGKPPRITSAYSSAFVERSWGLLPAGCTCGICHSNHWVLQELDLLWPNSDEKHFTNLYKRNFCFFF